MFYFSKDGQYGRTTDNPEWTGFAIPTWHWTDAMWRAVHSASADSRHDLASHLGYGFHDWEINTEDEPCAVCGLTRTDVGVKLLTVTEKQELMEEEYYNA